MNKAAIDVINVGRDVPIMVRQVKYLNHAVTRAHSVLHSAIPPKETTSVRWRRTEEENDGIEK